MKLKRFFTLLCAVVLSATVAFAQSSGDKLYNQGLQLQKTMTVAAQRSAIAKFQSAKKLYDSAAKKSQCDQAISVSNNIIANLSSGNSGKSVSPRTNNKEKQEKAKEPEKPQPYLNVTNSEFNIDLERKQLEVGVNTNIDGWSVRTIPCEDGSSFINVEKKGTTGIYLQIPENTTTMSRTQKVLVTADDFTREITVTQTGRRVDLDASVKNFDFKEKGGNKNFDVMCDSDQKYFENNDLNWYVESIPSWCKIVINSSKGKNIFQKAKDAVSNTINGSNNYSGGVKVSVKLICDEAKPGSIERHDGRKGEIVLRSGDKTLTLYVNQAGNWKTVDADHQRQVENLRR